MDFAIIGALIYVLAFSRYIYSTLKDKNKPNRATWFIWAFLGFILLFSYYSGGARETIPLLIVNQLGMCIIFLISLKFGEGGYTKFDIYCLFGAFVSILVWFISRNPLYALLFGILTDLFGALPTIKKSFVDPVHEDKITWILFLLGNSFNLLAIKNWNFEIYIYPLYMVLLCFTVLIILLRGLFCVRVK